MKLLKKQEIIITEKFDQTASDHLKAPDFDGVTQNNSEQFFEKKI